MTNCMKTCSFIHTRLTLTIKEVENFCSNAYENAIYRNIICCRYTLELPHSGNSNACQQCVTENKETLFEIYTEQ